jgi:hypothetical protein
VRIQWIALAALAMGCGGAPNTESEATTASVEQSVTAQQCGLGKPLCPHGAMSSWGGLPCRFLRTRWHNL